MRLRRHLQAVYSPLQGTQSIAGGQANSILQTVSAVGELPTTASKVAAFSNVAPKAAPESAIISEMENLAIDTHQQWLDAFVFTPIPALVVCCTAISDGDEVHQILQANSSAVMVFGRDAASLKAQNLEDIITLSGTRRAPSFRKGTGKGIMFSVTECCVQTMHQPTDSCLIFIPISDVCTVGPPSCFLVLILDTHQAVPMVASALSEIPSMEEVFNGITKGRARKGMFCSSQTVQSRSGTSPGDYCQAESLNVAHCEASKRLLDGKCPQCILPSPFDIATWTTKFSTLLTIPADK